MKPFNLEEALAGKPVQTRDGRKVTEIVHLKTIDVTYPIIAVVDKTPVAYTMVGREWQSGADSRGDLFMAPEIVTKWGNVYQNCNNGKYFIGTLFETEGEAKGGASNAPANYISTVPITIEI
jgi:hypothetical protein